MRDVIVLAFIATCACVALVHPWLGVLGWTLISIMNPHRYSWAASNMPVAAVIAVAIVLGMALTRDRVRLLVVPSTVALAAFMIWMCVTLPFSFSVDSSVGMWTKVMKIDFMIFVALCVLYTRRHIMALTWVLVGSIGFFGVKGGLFTLLSGGDFRVWGPPDSFIEGNNELALALIVIIPLMWFLQLQQTARWIRFGLFMAMVLTAASALGTHSRGALVAIVAMALVFWSRTRHKLVSGTVLVVLGVALIAFMPSSWSDRMATISTYEQDQSAMGRLNAWEMAWNLAIDRPFGGGFDIYRADIFARYAPVPDDIHAAHSIYFQVLGEHGFVGLGLFLLVWLFVWRSAGWLRRNAPLDPETKWARDLGGMIQASVAGYLVGGAFLSLAYFDLPYNLLVLSAITQRWVRDKGWEREPASPAATGPRATLSTAPHT